MQEVEYCVGDLGEDEYEANLWQDHDLRPQSDGRTFKAKVMGPSNSERNSICCN